MSGIQRFFIAAVLIAALALPAAALVHNVTVQNFAFSPANITVSRGDTVVWTNVQGVHNVHHTGNPSLFGTPVGSGWVYTFVFDLPAGRYDYVCEPHAPGMAGSVTVIPLDSPERPGGTPATVALEQNYPNPFNAVTAIEFAVPIETEARITILNVLGQEVARPFAGHVAAGQHRVAFDARGLAAGAYFYRLEAAGATQIRKMQFIK